MTSYVLSKKSLSSLIPPSRSTTLLAASRLAVFPILLGVTSVTSPRAVSFRSIHTTQTEGANNNNSKKTSSSAKDEVQKDDQGFVTFYEKNWENFKDSDFLQKIVKTDKKEQDAKVNDESPEKSSKTGNDFLDRLWQTIESSAPSSPFEAKKEEDTSEKKNPSGNSDESASFQDMGKTFLGLVTGVSSPSVEHIVSKARTMNEQGDVSDSGSIVEVIAIAQRAYSELTQTFDEFLEGVSISPQLNPLKIFYFLELEDQVKNPTYKRRKHNFCSGVGVEEVDTLNEQLRLALLSYSDSYEKIQTSLEDDFDCELVYCNMESFPGQPSHYLAVKKNQSFWSDSLEVVLVVRGTKTITDVITDLLCDPVSYRGGRAHSGILTSGQYLVKRHERMFDQLRQLAGKKKIKMLAIGHSLGAGAASIAGMELNDRDDFDVQVVGFGCPALLSNDLSEKTSSFITTVVADDDLIPRTSVATFVNVILDIRSHNWIPYARREIGDAINQFQKNFPLVMTEGNKKRVLSTVEDLLPAESTIPERGSKRMEPVLFPPGKCVHFYRDGFGISGSIVPCTFFNEIDFSRRMVHDHLIHAGYQLIFLDLMRQHHNDHYFRFDLDKKRS